MLSLEQNLTERALKANFNESQQAHFDKLMSELEQISGGSGFAELKAKAEAGSKEALQVMRDYIAKKEQIVEFIETKEMVVSPENEFVEITELEVGDDVVRLTVEEDESIHVRKGKVQEASEDGISVKLSNYIDTYPKNSKRFTKVAESVAEKYGGEEPNPGLVAPRLLELYEFKGYKVGDILNYGHEFFVDGDFQIRLVAFAINQRKLLVVYEDVDDMDDMALEEGEKREVTVENFGKFIEMQPE